MVSDSPIELIADRGNVTILLKETLCETLEVVVRSAPVFLLAVVVQVMVEEIDLS